MPCDIMSKNFNEQLHSQSTMHWRPTSYRGAGRRRRLILLARVQSALETFKQNGRIFNVALDRVVVETL
jgi:hypothetical protein